MSELPPRGTQEYDWWTKGAEAEVEARNEDLSAEQREIRDIFVDICRASRRVGGWSRDPLETLVTILVIYTAGKPWRIRARLAWRLLKG